MESTDIQPTLEFGQRLKKAREQLHLTEKEAANRLNLGTRLIINLENNQLSDAPHFTFFRGYVKAYGKLLNIPEHEIKIAIQDYQNYFTSKALFTMPQQPAAPAAKKHKPRYTHWVTLSLVLFFTVLVGMWWNSHARYAVADVPEKTLADATPSAESDVITTPPTATTVAPPTLSAGITPPTVPTLEMPAKPEDQKPIVTAEKTTPAEKPAPDEVEKPAATVESTETNSDPYNSDY